MIGASKILTVSYGTFSCTLEGFDEPFNTMKAIAEYFRDLAADDRYFGAEPPTPDAAMLHKIAEREVQRRVEAKIGDNGVHLRAQEAAELPALIVADTVVPERASLPTLTEIPDGVAARLAKIRASVAKGDADIAPVAAAFVEPEYSEDQHADEFADDLADLAIFEDEGIAPIDIAPAEAMAEQQSALADDEPDADMLADLAALDLPPAAPEFDTANDPIADADDDFDMASLNLAFADPVAAEAEAPADVTADVADDALSARLGALIDPDESADAPGELTDTAPDADMLADLVTYADEAPGDPAPLPETVVQDTAAAFVADAADATTDDMIAQADDVVTEVATEVAADVATEATLEAPTDTPAEPVAEAIPAAPELSDKLQRARARVIRVRRSPEIAAVADVPKADTPAPAAAGLTDEAEAELARDLAALEGPDAPAPIADDDADLRRQLAMIEDEAADPTPAPPQDLETTTHAAMANAVQDAAVSRLMQQTQSEMAVPENRRRLSAIAHLKAAVAATVADRFGSKAKPDEAEATRSEPYRDDLARVVRPRRPESAAAAPTRPAPLVLVSEQRIDRPAPSVAPATHPATISPVRPRRVASAALAPQLAEEFDNDDDEDDENIFADAKGFAEFADRLGAQSLPDMLEAAAAYAATVEGRSSFSRPQLMRQVSMATGDADISREDGLRSFGTLLRDGRIVKVRRGQFSLTESSRFMAEAKKIAD